MLITTQYAQINYLLNYATKNTRLNSLSRISGPTGDSMDEVVMTRAYCMLSISSGQDFGLLFNHRPQWTLHILTEVLHKLITAKTALTKQNKCIAVSTSQQLELSS